MFRSKFRFIAIAVLIGWFSGVATLHATPGDACDPQAPINSCDACNRETCQANANVFQCADGTYPLPSSFTNPSGLTPFCPAGVGDPTFPGCWTDCSVDNLGNPQCAPNNTWCGVGVCGGEECTTDSLAGGDGCVALDPPVPPNPVCDDTPGICGNGVCEPGENVPENCDNCIDCLAAGEVCDNTTGQLCVNGPEICEDGDVCTLNTCGGSSAAPICQAPVPVGCSGDVSDGCCPSGCTPQTGGSCATSDPNCDVDCIPEPSPSPSPSPAPPAFVGCLQGSGNVTGGSGGPGCGGSACSLNPFAEDASGTELLAFLGILGAAGYALIRGKKIPN